MEVEYIECPYCGKPDCNKYQTYCMNCGKPLANYCTAEDCEYNTLEIDSALPDNACYCPACGSKTAFFAAGAISSLDFRS